MGKIDDQHRNPNMNNEDYLVRQLTCGIEHLTLLKKILMICVAICGIPLDYPGWCIGLCIFLVFVFVFVCLCLRHRHHLSIRAGVSRIM